MRKRNGPEGDKGKEENEKNLKRELRIKFGGKSYRKRRKKRKQINE